MAKTAATYSSGQVWRTLKVAKHRLEYLTKSGKIELKKDGTGRYVWTDKEVAIARKLLNGG